MAHFFDLPDEIVQRIFELLLPSRVSLRNIGRLSRRFTNVTSPLLVREWANRRGFISDPCIQRLALHLLRYPNLRKHVKILDLNVLTPISLHVAVLNELNAESLAALAEAAAQDVVLPPGLLSILCQQIRQGCEDAIAVLVLAWSTKLTHLSITVEEGRDLMTLRFIKQAVCRLRDDTIETAELLPLSQVRHIVFRGPGSGRSVAMKYVTPFFHLPNIESLETYGLRDGQFAQPDNSTMQGDQDDNYALPFPAGTSTVKDIIISQAQSLGDGFSPFISTSRELRKLVILMDVHESFGSSPEQKDLARIIRKHKDSLKQLELYISPERNQRNACSVYPRLDYSSLLQKSFQHLSQVWRLSIAMTDLFELRTHERVNPIRIALGRIPPSIKHIKTRCPCFIDKWYLETMLIQPYFVGFIELLEQAGPEGRFRDLKVLDLSETFVNDPSSHYISTIKLLGKSHGIQVLLHETLQEPSDEDEDCS
ncbi:hypothetical protein F53441_1225 [Fusarium austroafricanum]|uniref:F-box domain-containing protein n=1 Tax=Fusarium austroafricanum TaxID=2364996 RepID=A0A8H4KVZ7_9HYPO|nr:hypothetical protein F53441_1225 [Fusarium austroafricanum]